jgi:hypothetical protein
MNRFSSVRRPQGSEFLQRSALLFPPVDQVTDAAGRQRPECGVTV